VSLRGTKVILVASLLRSGRCTVRGHVARELEQRRIPCFLLRAQGPAHRQNDDGDLHLARSTVGAAELTQAMASLLKCLVATFVQPLNRSGRIQRRYRTPPRTGSPVTKPPDGQREAAIRFKILQTTAGVDLPGSPAARARGCGCPVGPNRSGTGWEVSDEVTRRGFWIEDGCRVHGQLASTTGR